MEDRIDAQKGILIEIVKYHLRKYCNLPEIYIQF